MDGSHLYTPTVSVEEVVLAESKKKLVLVTMGEMRDARTASRVDPR